MMMKLLGFVFWLPLVVKDLPEFAETSGGIATMLVLFSIVFPVFTLMFIFVPEIGVGMPTLFLIAFGEYIAFGLILRLEFKSNYSSFF